MMHVRMGSSYKCLKASSTMGSSRLIEDLKFSHAILIGFGRFQNKLFLVIFVPKTNVSKYLNFVSGPYRIDFTVSA